MRMETTVIISTILFKTELLTYNQSSSDASDDEDIILIAKYVKKKRRRKSPSRIQNFVEQTVPNFLHNEFQSHFRITRETLHHVLGHQDLSNMHQRGRDTVNPEKQLLAVLWLLATPGSYRSVGCRFNLAKSSLSRCFVRVVKALNIIAPRVIQWPNKEARRHISNRFQRMAGLGGVVGAVDGTCRPMKAPREHPEVYINRKCFYGLTLQAICDDKRPFIDCYTGWPNSVSDIRIFRNSHICHDILDNADNYFEQRTYIIGDKSYPVTPWCIPPYIARGQLTDNHRKFNQIHSKTRQVIERAFALLFGRFRRLRYVDMNMFTLIPATIIACCVLHNICLSRPYNFLNVYENEGLPFVIGDELAGQGGEVRNENNDQGRDYRDQIVRILQL